MQQVCQIEGRKRLPDGAKEELPGWSLGGVRVEIQWSRSALFGARLRGKSLKNGHSSEVYVYYSNFYLYLCFY